MRKIIVCNKLLGCINTQSLKHSSNTIFRDLGGFGVLTEPLPEDAGIKNFGLMDISSELWETK